jgi:hypothetical protein
LKYDDNFLRLRIFLISHLSFDDNYVYDSGYKITNSTFVFEKDTWNQDSLDIYELDDSYKLTKKASIEFKADSYSYCVHDGKIFVFGTSSSSDNDVSIYDESGNLIKKIDIPYDDGSIKYWTFGDKKLYLITGSSRLVVIDLDSSEIIYDNKPEDGFSYYNTKGLFVTGNKLVILGSYGKISIYDISGNYPKKEKDYYKILGVDRNAQRKR